VERTNPCTLSLHDLSIRVLKPVSRRSPSVGRFDSCAAPLSRNPLHRAVSAFHRLVACDCKLGFSVRTLGSSSPHLKRDLRLRAEKEPFSVSPASFHSSGSAASPPARAAMRFGSSSLRSNQPTALMYPRDQATKLVPRETLASPGQRDSRPLEPTSADAESPDRGNERAGHTRWQSCSLSLGRVGRRATAHIEKARSPSRKPGCLAVRGLLWESWAAPFRPCAQRGSGIRTRVSSHPVWLSRKASSEM
jgi:hypothetical protein